ncbi:hypothetical protein Celaphus_00013849 [Cervus elaphus hippelaphus]|uniref:Protein SDA1 n=1 Tax=Cervus elaphus hippelaphus TaxID=46360 RepID=A0A212CCA9_CEREH|nr:hypothetical protein Celaphus_00013849 [Cervus elaphus hippelaphus]
MLRDSSATAAKISLEVMTKLQKKQTGKNSQALSVPLCTGFCSSTKRRNKTLLFALPTSLHLVVPETTETLIQFFQKLNPQISQKELQGKPTEASIKSRVQEYGDLDAKDYIPGTALLKAEEQNTENHPDRMDEGLLWEEMRGEQPRAEESRV